MVEELFRDLKKTYDSIKLVIAAKSLAIEMEKGVEYDYQYDLPILTIRYKDLSEGEEDNLAHRLIQVRMRKDKDCDEELVIVMQTNGATKTIEDIDKDLLSAAAIVEKYTEEFLLDFPDVVYDYEWTDISKITGVVPE